MSVELKFEQCGLGAMESQDFPFGKFRVVKVTGEKWELQLVFRDGSVMELSKWEACDDAIGDSYFFYELVSNVYAIRESATDVVDKVEEIKQGDMEGRKDDSSKFNDTLLDEDIRRELITFASCFRVDKSTSEDPVTEGFLYQVEELVRARLYIPAAVLVMKTTGIKIKDIINIYMGGAKKYAPHNWKKVRPVDRYLAAAHRHLKAGDNDDDFGGPHLAYFCWNMVALRWFERHGIRMESDVTTTECELHR